MTFRLPKQLQAIGDSADLSPRGFDKTQSQETTHAAP